MKTTLKISIFAILIAVPVMARASVSARNVVLVNDGNTPTPTQTLASKSYVQGAYNELGTQINNIISDTTIPAGEYNTISATNNVAENLIALDNVVQTATNISGTYVSQNSAAAVVDSTGGATGLQYVSANGTKVGENLGILDNQVYKVATKIGSTAMGTSAPTVTGAIAEMHTQTIAVATTWGDETNTTPMNIFPQP